MLRVSWRALLLWVVITACTGASLPPVTPIAAPAAAEQADTAGYAATVTPEGVRLVFPPAARDTFEWWSPGQRRQLSTYSWTVIVRGRADTAYSVGYWLPAIGFEAYARVYAERGPVPEGRQRGGLTDLLRAGEQDVRMLEDHVAFVVPEMRAHVTAEGQRVVVEVREARSVRRLFALRPSHVTFYTYLPEERPRVAHVPVTYLDR
jgi:hypothetical protein